MTAAELDIQRRRADANAVERDNLQRLSDELRRELDDTMNKLGDAQLSERLQVTRAERAENGRDAAIKELGKTAAALGHAEAKRDRLRGLVQQAEVFAVNAPSGLTGQAKRWLADAKLDTPGLDKP